MADLHCRQALLHRRERELVEGIYLRRIDGFESIRDALRRLAEVGSAHAILSRAPAELGAHSRFDRVLISGLGDGQLVPLVLWERDNARPDLPEAFDLSYPMIEQEMARHREAAVQVVPEARSRTPRVLSDRFRWGSYVVGTIAADGGAIGLLHADARLSGRRLDEVDSQLVLLSCAGLGELFERATLRETLQRHRAELQSAVSWLGSRLRATTPSACAAASMAAPNGKRVDVDSLTPREQEILALLAKGQTNAQIASAIGIKEGTVKYHVKNLLRKLGARSRADAVARFARSTGGTPR